ncbi:hypothetical protein [Brevibacterium casei]|uniref:hypothetical protein n=1 Tax=Brevibacterium casei TaxID=33889 RepID=UPI0036FA07D6
MSSENRPRALVNILGCSVFVSVNIGFAYFYNAVGLGIVCLVVLGIIVAEKRTSFVAAIKATRDNPAVGPPFTIAGIVSSLTLLANVVLVMPVEFNSALVVGSGSSGLILAVIAGLSYVPFFIQNGRASRAR